MSFITAPLFGLTLALCVGCSSQHELDTICHVFIDLERQPALIEMDHAARMAFVNERVSQRISSFGDVSRAWALVPSFVPEARYRMFKRIADELLGTWDCAAMERLAPTLSEPIVGSE